MTPFINKLEVESYLKHELSRKMVSTDISVVMCMYEFGCL
jgi:hypothetical protein